MLNVSIDVPQEGFPVLNVTFQAPADQGETARRAVQLMRSGDRRRSKRGWRLFRRLVRDA